MVLCLFRVLLLLSIPAMIGGRHPVSCACEAAFACWSFRIPWYMCLCPFHVLLLIPVWTASAMYIRVVDCLREFEFRLNSVVHGLVYTLNLRGAWCGSIDFFVPPHPAIIFTFHGYFFSRTPLQCRISLQVTLEEPSHPVLSREHIPFHFHSFPGDTPLEYGRCLQAPALEPFYPTPSHPATIFPFHFC